MLHRPLGIVLLSTLWTLSPGRVNGQTPGHDAGFLLPPVASAMEGAGQFVDRRPPEPPQRPRWGVRAGFTPLWSTPSSWSTVLLQTNYDPVLNGRDLRVGIVRGRPLGFEFGLSFVRKTIKKDLIFVRDVYAASGTPPNFTYTPVPNVTYTGIDDILFNGVDFHVLIPAARLGRRAQIGVLLGAGYGVIPETPVQKHVIGPPFFSTCPAPFSSVGTADPPPGGGFVLDELGQCAAVPPGQRAGTITATMRDFWRYQEVWPIIEAQVALDVRMTSFLKLRIAGGFNSPGAQLVGVDLVCLFGRN